MLHIACDFYTISGISKENIWQCDRSVYKIRDEVPLLGVGAPATLSITIFWVILTVRDIFLRTPHAVYREPPVS